jgi:putative photosynthetic complex assembly protein 2
LDYAWPIALAVFLWWFSTGIIFYLDGLPVKSFKWSMLGGTALTVLAFGWLWSSVGDATVWAAIAGFASALVIWGWMEMSLYMGFVTGPRKQRCAKGCKGVHHFGHAIAANLWHELAIIAGALVIAAMSWNAENQTGLWSYLILWLMHLSARLNVFLGVRNVSEEFVPAHMDVLKGFLRQKRMNVLFPFSILVSTMIAVWMVQQTMAATDSFAITSWCLLTAIMVIGVVEHWLLMLPIPFARLWAWSLKARDVSSFAIPAPQFIPLAQHKTGTAGQGPIRFQQEMRP